MKKYSIPLIVILLLGTFGMITLAGVSVGFLLVAIPALLIWLFAWILPAVLKRVDSKVWIAIGILILIGLIFPTSSLMSSDYEAGPFSTPVSTIIFLLPSLALVGAAVLLYSVLSFYYPNDVSESESMKSEKRQGNGLPLIALLLAAILVIKTLHNLYGLTLWDNTFDPLGYLWLILPIFIALLSGMTLFITLPYRTKPAGIFYVLIVPIFLVAVSALAQSVDFRQETTKRAEQVAQAVDSYYAREGMYPETLSQLTPWYGVPLPKPIIIYGQDWCYESGADYYRLGYIDREHWSDPRMIGHIYKSVGEVPDTQPMCMAEFNALQDHQYSYWKEIK